MDLNSARQLNGSSPAKPADVRLWSIFLVVSLSAAILARLIQHELVWVEEAYGLAAAAEVLRGKLLYRDIWFDKPPFYAWFYLLCGAHAGWPLRILGSAHMLAIAWAVKWTGEQFWGPREGLLASALCCLSLTFWISSAVLAAAPDLLMIVPHVLAVGLAAKRRPLASGVTSGLGLLCNSRGLFVLVAAALWSRGALGWLVGGFLLVQVAAAPLLPLPEYWREVWAWGFVYSSATFLVHPLRDGLTRTVGWAGFHAASVVGAVTCLARERNWRLALWMVLSIVAVAAGWRFFPRYYFHLLPVVALAGARGLIRLPVRLRSLALILLLIPVVRFGPRYASIALAGTTGWTDVAMMEDSREVGERLRTLSHPDSTVLVWGYRPDVFVFSGLAAGTRFLDSQPLTGVLADRHLTDSTVLFPDLAARHRLELSRTAPEFIVDGLGPLNPQLAIHAYPDLQAWLRGYQVIGRTRMSVLYRARPQGRASAQER